MGQGNIKYRDDPMTSKSFRSFRAFVFPLQWPPKSSRVGLLENKLEYRDPKSTEIIWNFKNHAIIVQKLLFGQFPE